MHILTNAAPKPPFLTLPRQIFRLLREGSPLECRKRIPDNLTATRHGLYVSGKFLTDFYIG